MLAKGSDTRPGGSEASSSSTMGHAPELGLGLELGLDLGLGVRGARTHGVECVAAADARDVDDELLGRPSAPLRTPLELHGSALLKVRGLGLGSGLGLDVRAHLGHSHPTIHLMPARWRLGLGPGSNDTRHLQL
eukprot:scaffold32667_cov45-Phaeocystis_antarctica.AAC.5